MSILNKSITPHGSHSMVAPQSSTQFRRKMTMVASSHSSTESSHRRTQLGAKQQRLSGVLEFDNNNASKLFGLLHQEELCNFIPDPIAHVNTAKAFTTVPDDAAFKPFTLGFIWSLMENEQISMIKDKMASLDFFGSELPADTLVVSVSSAVKLQHHQMDQIAKKMQKLTGAIRVSIKNTIDPSLIAGFVISYEKEGTHVIDLSVKGKLDELVAHIESKDQSYASNYESCMFMHEPRELSSNT